MCISRANIKQRKNHYIFSGGAFDPGIDLLKGLANISQYEGVSITQGTQKKIAFKLQGTNRKLVLPFKTYERAVELLKKNSDFTFAATLKQDERNPGTIISFSNGYNRYEMSHDVQRKFAKLFLSNPGSRTAFNQSRLTFIFSNANKNGFRVNRNEFF
jgi:hypothetical protein